MKDWYNYSWIDTVKELGSDEKTGLTKEKVEFLKSAAEEENILLSKKKYVEKFLSNSIRDPWLLLSFFSSLGLFVLGSYYTGIIFILLTLVSAFTYNYDSYKRRREIDELEKINYTPALVLRNGRLNSITADELVVGDIVYLEKGKIVPADLRIIESDNIKVKQTSVTGEVYEVEKYETKIVDRDITLSEMKNIAFKSSIILDGSGIGAVIAIGSDTEVGKIVKNLFEHKEKMGSVYNKIKSIIKKLTWISLFVLPINLVFGLLNKINLITFLKGSIYTIIVISPLNLILTTSIAIIFIYKFFKKKDLEIRNITSLELAGNLDTIITEKIGFISEQKMAAVKIYTEESIKDIDKSNTEIDKNIERMVHIALLCNDSNKQDVEDISLVELGRNYSIDRVGLQSKYRRIFEIPYDNQRRMKTTVNKIEKKYRANVKGAVDAIIEKCTHIMKDGVEGEITKEDIENIRNADMEMSGDGLLVSALAYRNFNYEPSRDENIESYLVFVGLIGFINPIKEDTNENIERTKVNNISLVFSTVDGKLTATSLCKNLSLDAGEESVISGVEIESVQDEVLLASIDKIKILSRVTDEEKLRIIRCLQVKDRKLGITGSKLTDIPLMESAYISIAYGENCSAILKNTADAYYKDLTFKKLLDFCSKSKKIVQTVFKLIKYNVLISLCEGSYFMFLSLNRNLKSEYISFDFWMNFTLLLLSSSLLFLLSLREGKEKHYEKKKVNLYLMACIIGTLNYLFFMILSNIFPNLTLFISALLILISEFYLLWSVYIQQ